MDEKESVKLEIYGQIFRLRSSSPAELLQLARAVDKRMHEFAEQYDKVSVTQLAILAAMSAEREATDAAQENAALLRRLSLLEQRVASAELAAAGQSRH